MTSSASCPEMTDHAGRSGFAHFYFWFIVIITVVSDLAGKWWAFRFLKVGEEISIIPNILNFSPTQNFGAVFGLAPGKWWLLIGASVFAIYFILQLFWQSRKSQRVFHIFLALVLGGALGNLYDRILYGNVRDFIHIAVKITDNKYLWPWVFNIADIALVVGVAGLLLGWFLGKFDIGTSCPVARPASSSSEKV